MFAIIKLNSYLKEMMSKKAKIIIGSFVSILIVLGIVIYVFFPKIWGSVMYPLEYKDYIVKYSKEYNIDPAFVSAVIYSESHFNKDAISRVGARGLMQIMPETGRGIAGALGEDGDYTVSRLDNPEKNIQYGIWYLADLLKDWNGDEAAALAGYNGGPAVAGRYVVSRSDASIPNETANYIRNVLSVKEKYKELYYNELYTQGVSGENVADKLKVTQPEKEKTWWQKIVEQVKNR